MTYIGDKGRKIYGTFTWEPAARNVDGTAIPQKMKRWTASTRNTLDTSPRSEIKLGPHSHLQHEETRTDWKVWQICHVFKSVRKTVWLRWEWRQNGKRCHCSEVSPLCSERKMSRQMRWFNSGDGREHRSKPRDLTGKHGSDRRWRRWESHAVKRFRKQRTEKDSDELVKTPSATYTPPLAFRTAEKNVIFHRFSQSVLPLTWGIFSVSIAWNLGSFKHLLTCWPFLNTKAILKLCGLRQWYSVPRRRFRARSREE